MKRGIVWAVLLSIAGVSGAVSVHAATFNSTNFSINGNLGDSAAGAQTSTNYRMTSAAGESIAGTSSSKSYKLGQGYVPTLENSIQLITQPNGLAGYWPLDGVVAGRQAIDESQYGNNGEYSASSLSVPGKVGTAWADTNANQSVSIPDSASMPAGTAMTTETWIRPASLTGQRGIITKWDYAVGGGGQGEWALQLSPTSGELRMYVSSGSGDTGANYIDTTNAALTTNTWFHVAVVYDGTQAAADRVKIYVNGSAKTTNVTGTIPSTLYAAGTNPVTIGSFPGQSRFWSGRIDEAKIFGRALSQPEVQAEYSASNVGVASGLGLGSVIPGTSRTSQFDSIVQSSSPGYSLAINQDRNLQVGDGGANTDVYESLDNLSNGTNLTAGNTDFDSILTGASSTITASTASPVQGAFGRIQTVTTSTGTVNDIYSTVDTRYYRLYMRMSAIPAAAETLINLRNSSGTIVAAVRVLATGSIQLRDGLIAESNTTTTIAPNEWFRVEWFYDATSSSQTLRLFSGANVNGKTPTETITGAATNGSQQEANIGIVTSQANQTLDFDEYATGTAGWIGPTGASVGAIPSVGGSIASPTAWSEGVTKGLGFTLTGTNATSIPGAWNSGNSYAAIPANGTTFYTRTGYTAGARDVLNMRLRLDIPTSQNAGDYSNKMTITGTMTP